MTIDVNDTGGLEFADEEPVATSDDQPLSTARDEDLDETNPDSVILARPEWGSVSMLAAAASLGGSVPDAIATANMQLFVGAERHGEFSISNGGGPVGQLTQEEIAAEGREEEDSWVDQLVDALEKYEEEERLERERRWDAEMHDFAGMQMSGEDIDTLMDFIRDPKQRQALIERRAKEKNISTQQATKDIDNALRYGELYKKIHTGQATPAEKEEYRRLEADPNVIETVTSAKKQMTESFTANSSNFSTSQLSGTAASTESAVDILDSPFPSAPLVAEHFEEAKAATVPLDAKPVQVAAVTPIKPPPQVAAAGFDS